MLSLKESSASASLSFVRQNVRKASVASRSLRIVCQEISFRSHKTMNLPYVEKELSAEDYLSRTERIVRVAFPDKNRIRYLGDDNWRSRLKPVTFFIISATPVCDLQYVP